MTNAEKIEEYTKAAARSGLPVRSVVIEKGKVVVNFATPKEQQSEGEGLRKNWTVKK